MILVKKNDYARWNREIYVLYSSINLSMNFAFL